MIKVARTAAVRQARSTDRCHRCGGLMVPEKVFELGSFDWRCVSCGERVDPVILAHREAHRPKSFAREEAEKLFIGYGKSRLN
jgi:tRNA(Ile2) C34 agmatinyltransferase TiaS